MPEPLEAFFSFLPLADRCATGVVNSYGVYQQYYSSSRLQSHSEPQIARTGSMQGFLLLVSGITGRLDDAKSACLVYGGTSLTILGMMMTNICQTFGELLVAQGIVVGIGDGLLFPPSIAIVSPYFDKRRALATGIASMENSIGTLCPYLPYSSSLLGVGSGTHNGPTLRVIYPIVFRRQLQQSTGFPRAARVVAFIMLATFIITVSFVK